MSLIPVTRITPEPVTPILARSLAHLPCTPAIIAETVDAQGQRNGKTMVVIDASHQAFTSLHAHLVTTKYGSDMRDGARYTMVVRYDLFDDFVLVYELGPEPCVVGHSFND